MIDALIEMLQASNPFLIVIAGLMIGLVHAFEPDHISAVSTQVLNTNNRNSKKANLKTLTILSSFKGILWGMGHTSSIILIGLLVAGLSLSISDTFFLSAEIVVGFMLIVLGVLTAANKSVLRQKHTHPHEHSNGISHIHPHTHNTDHKHGHKSYIIGCIHGLAGSGSLVALVASTMSSFDIVVYFLILFGIGSIIGMALASGILGISFMLLLPKISLAAKYLRYVIASITLVIGINIVFTVGLESNLFSLN